MCHSYSASDQHFPTSCLFQCLCVMPPKQHAFRSEWCVKIPDPMPVKKPDEFSYLEQKYYNTQHENRGRGETKLREERAECVLERNILKESSRLLSDVFLPAYTPSHRNGEPWWRICLGRRWAVRQTVFFCFVFCFFWFFCGEERVRMISRLLVGTSVRRIQTAPM